MADPRPQAAYLYTETRLNLDRAHAASTVLLELPTPSSLPHRAPPRRHVLLQDGIGRSRGGAADEASFARAHLAGDGGVFFRRADRYPRSLLWRLLDGRALLEVQSVDLAQDVGERDEASLTVQLRFPGAVRPHAVGFADPDESDALVVFAVTASGELYTVVLHRDMFVHLKASETPPPDWCAVFSPPALRIKEPFKLLVHSAHQLFLSLSDGGILMLDRKRGDDGMALLASDANADETGSLWRETYFTPPGWSLTIPRALAKWRGDSFVRFGDVELDPSTATSMAISPEEDTIITVCLNHTLRVWSLSTGKIVMQTDLLEDDGQNVQNQPKFLLGPNQRQLLAVSDVAGEDQDKYYIITFSPKLHKFSFWAVLDASSGLEGMRRVRPDFEFAPPIDDLMGTSAWIMEEFFVCPGSKWANTQLWLRARSGQVSRVFTVQFNLFGELDQIVAAWTHAWSAVSAGRQSSDSLSSEVPAVVRADDAIRYPGVSERWLAFLFYPGRFTLATLDTAFQVYSKRGSAKGSLASSSSGILKERMSAAVASRASSTDEVRLSEEWHVLYGLVHDLHKRRATTLSFAMDTIDRLPWIVAADFVSPVRVCTELDIYDFHRTAERSIAADEQIAARLSTSFESLDLLQAAHLFRSSLSPQAREQFSRIVFAFALEQPSASVVDRMMSLHEQADLSSVSDDDWNRVRDAMDEFGGLSVLDGANFTGVMELMDQSQAGRRNTDQITKYGARALNRVAQETTVLNLKVLLDLLLLVVFVEVEVDESELDADMENKWEGQDLFCSILGRLKETFVLDFLMKHWRTEQRKRLRSSSSSDNLVTSPSASQALQRSSYTSTLLESFFIGDWASMRVPENAEMPSLLTYWARQWTASFDLATNYDGFTAHVLAELIKMRDVALCTAFLPFAASTGWSTYLKARFHLMRADFDLAARGFKRAAFLLSLSDFNVTQLDSAGLLRADERSSFAAGLVAYHTHIADLFAHAKCSSDVAAFAQIALRHLSSQALSGETEQRQQSDLLSRLFTAALSTGQPDLAYAALTRQPDPALRRAELSALVTAALSSAAAGARDALMRVLEMPFAADARELDDILAARAAAGSGLADAAAGAPHRDAYGALYALRVRAGDLRGAAQCAWEYLARLRGGADSAPAGRGGGRAAGPAVAVADPRDERVVGALLVVVNALRCCAADEAWVLDDPRLVGAAGKRRVLWLADVRREYVGLLDRISEVESGKYAFVGGDDEMDVDAL